MTTKKTTLISAAILLALLTTGCAIGNKGKLYYNRTTTVGQEMIDLKTALDSGAVTQAEYDTLKAELMKINKFKFRCSENTDSKDKQETTTE